MENSAMETLLLKRTGGCFHVTLNRPEARNALSEEMVDELRAVAIGIAEDPSIRALVLRGAGGTFCAGGDIKGFRASFETPPPKLGEPDPIATHNRRFGEFLTVLDSLPQTVVAVVEGMAFGGGFGLACIADVTIATSDARFALSETTLGVIPAQIAPFVVRRIGLSQARRLALTAARLDGTAALAIGLVHMIASGGPELEATLARVLTDLGRCAPGANAATKAILRMSAERPLAQVLDDAATQFALCLRGDEGRDGVAAFIEKRPARWVETFE
jgi:isohexenylglutaconyl-CoA hydratase